MVKRTKRTYLQLQRQSFDALELFSQGLQGCQRALGEGLGLHRPPCCFGRPCVCECEREKCVCVCRCWCVWIETKRQLYSVAKEDTNTHTYRKRTRSRVTSPSRFRGP